MSSTRDQLLVLVGVYSSLVGVREDLLCGGGSDGTCDPSAQHLRVVTASDALTGVVGYVETALPKNDQYGVGAALGTALGAAFIPDFLGNDRLVEGQVHGHQVPPELQGRSLLQPLGGEFDDRVGDVHSVDAWDYGRASAMARWGVAARLCSVAEAESAVIRAGRLVQVNYRSWADFSAAYALGRCLRFDQEEFGDWYEKSLRTHRALMTDPASPWLTIPWS